MAEHEEGAKAGKEEPVGPQHADSELRPPHPTWAQMSRARARHPVETGWVPAWLRPTGPENHLPVAASILVAIALQIWLSGNYGLHPRWLLPVLEIALLVVLTAINPVRLSQRDADQTLPVHGAGRADHPGQRGVGPGPGLRHRVWQDEQRRDRSAQHRAAIYLTNIIVFGIWYWELDRGGPFNRAAGTDPHPYFLFPQMVSPEMGPEHWEPRYLDYLYTSFTNVMAFSPTDTMPLSRWAKSLMALQSAIALSTTALVLARAVNILK